MLTLLIEETSRFNALLQWVAKEIDNLLTLFPAFTETVMAAEEVLDTIQEVTSSIQDTVLVIWSNFVDRIFPERLGQGEELSLGPIQRDYNIPTTCDSEVCQIKAERSGYLQAVDNDALMRIAVEENLLIHLGYRPGNFITRRSVLVTVWPGEKVDEKLSRKINAIFSLIFVWIDKNG